MNKSDLTKAMLVGVAKVFNKEILEADEPMPDGSKRGHTIPAMTKEIVDAANALLEKNDKDFFNDEQIEVMGLIGVDVDSIFELSTETVEEDEGGSCECATKDDVKEIVEEVVKEKKTSKAKGKGKGKGKAQSKDKKETKPKSKDKKEVVKEKVVKEKKETKKSNNEKKNTTKPMGVGKFILNGVKSKKFKDMSNQEIADLVRSEFPGSVTTAAHVGTYKYRIEKGILK